MLNYEALDLVTSQVNGSVLKRSRLRKQIEKLHKRGKLDFSQLDEEWRWRMCCARMRLGDFSDWDGWQFRSDWSRALHTEKVNIPQWDGRPYRGTKLLILGEEGIGDEVMHASVIPEAIIRLGHNGVVYECNERLHGLIERSFHIKCLPRKKLNEYRTGITHWIAQGDLSALFRMDKSHFPGKPYLKADPVRVEQADYFLRKYPKPWVGISWSGKHALIDPQAFRTTGTMINIQYDHKAPQWAVEPPIDLKNDIEGVYGYLSVLDRVDTVSTSLVHFSGSIGVPTNLVLSPRPEEQDIEYSINWRVGNGKTHTWHKSVRVYRTLAEYSEKNHEHSS